MAVAVETIRNQRGKLVVMGVLVVILAVLGFLLSRRNNTQIDTGNFTFLNSITGLTTPLGVGTDRDENIYVSNTGASSVDVFDKDGNKQYSLNTTDEAGKPLKFNAPYGIAIDDEHGKIYVVDYTWRGVRVLDKGGNFLYNLPQDPNADLQDDPKIGFSPYGVAVAGDKVFISAQDGLYVFDSDGNYVKHIGTFGQAVGQYGFVDGVAADSSTGNLFVADTLNRRIVCMDFDGNIHWIIGTPDVNGDVTSPLQLPRAIAIGPDGLVYVTDTFEQKIVVFDQDGNLQSTFGERGTQDTQVNFPEGIAITSSRLMYVADRENNRVQIWRLANPVPPVEDKSLLDKYSQALKKY